MEYIKLIGIHWVIRLVGTSQMGHHNCWPLRQSDFRDRCPFIPFHAKPVHTRIKLNAKRMAGQGVKMTSNLFKRIQDRRQA